MQLKLISGICAAAMAASLAVPAMAAPLRVSPVASQNNLVEIQYRIRDRDGERRWHRGDRDRDGERRWRRGDRDRDRDFRRDGRYAYFNGHRGYRERRPGYRYRDGFWFPPAAFALGVITGSIINNATPAPRYREGLPRAHVEYCFDRYRSYRVSDNTFQPYNGPREQCRSPYL